MGTTVAVSTTKGKRMGLCFTGWSGTVRLIMNERHVILEKNGFIIDMDGVIYHGSRLLPGAERFVAWLQQNGKGFLFLTNSSERSQRELREKLLRMGMDVAEEHFYTSALATAAFLVSQKPGGSVYVIGQPGLINALYDAGFAMNNVNPDYVVVGESPSYNFDNITQAIRLVVKGAKLIGTNSDLTGPTEEGIVPATGALITPIEKATGCKAYFVGKPNPLIMRHALRTLGCKREETAIIGDRMDTDIVAGIESGIETVLVLSGVTTRAEMARYAYQPRYVAENLAALVD